MDSPGQELEGETLMSGIEVLLLGGAWPLEGTLSAQIS